MSKNHYPYKYGQSILDYGVTLKRVDRIPKCFGKSVNFFSFQHFGEVMAFVSYYTLLRSFI